MISAFTILSNPDKYGYPWREAVKSFLNSGVVDELVVVYNPYSEEDFRQELRDMGCRVVSGLFDLVKVGWLSYGIVRTTGYQACKGDFILMFDADGVLHEKDYGVLKQEVNMFQGRDDVAYGFWTKYRIFKPDTYWLQNKHSGWYNKRLLGDNFDFYAPDGRGIPNWWALPEKWKSGKQLSATLFGYEHTWDTKEAFIERMVNYGHMKAKLNNQPVQPDEFYVKEYIDDLKASLDKKGKKMDLSAHPAIMKERLDSINESHFGYNFFGML